jgi:hypothetical protein
MRGVVGEHPSRLLTLRRAANLLNLSTPAGLVLALAAGCEVHAGPRGLLLATGYGFETPDVPAFTVGNVVLTPHDLARLEDSPALLRHEDRHATQYAWCLGLPLLPLYAVASAWSWVRGGDFAVHNVFERRAGLVDGGYPVVSSRARQRAHAAAS